MKWGGGRSFHLEHIKKQTHHPRLVGKPGSAGGASQADNSCERPCHPTDPITSGCKWPGRGGRLAEGSGSRDRASCRHAARRGRGCTCPPCTALQALPATLLAQRHGCWMCPRRLAQHRGCCMCPLCTVLWVLCATHLHSVTRGLCPPQRQPHTHPGPGHPRSRAPF